MSFEILFVKSSKLCPLCADPEMQNDIDICISNGKAEFDVLVLVCIKMLLPYQFVY
jgi:hypothetical protein